MQPHNSRSIRILDFLFLLGAIAILILFTTVFLMPFRLDDVLHMDWAREHSFWDAFDVQKGEIVRSVRPVFAITIWLLTRYAGITHYFPWHFVLVSSFLIGLAYTGLTARYISKNDSALYFTTGLFWLAFLPILNVLFWYGDLTYTVELLFIGPAWYYGLRGLLEAKITYWIVSLVCSILAVLSKEPALLLTHGVFIGTAILCRKEIRLSWKNHRIIAIAGYSIFLLISILLFLGSPTKSNRFFPIGTMGSDKLLFFVNDRLRYYGETLLNPLARMFLLTPLLFRIFSRFFRTLPLRNLLLILLLAIVISLFVKSLFFFSFILLLAVLLYNGDVGLRKMLTPFTIVALIILGTLLVTVMLVKTQLTELAFVLLVITGCYWSLLLKDFATSIAPHWQRKNFRLIMYSSAAAAAIATLILLLPVLQSKEQLLENVRDVRTNANDAIQWMGAQLPRNSEILVGGTRLYGLGEKDDMTPKEDEYKLYAQYTFLQGYIRSYFHALNRPDLSLGYLDDSVLLSRILDSCRSSGTYYLFLQTGLDVDRFHGEINGIRELKSSDSLVARFSKGPYPSEVWKLRRED